MTDTTTTIATAYTSARRHLERAAELLSAKPAREIARNCAQICRDLAVEAIKPRPEINVAHANRVARSDAALLITTHSETLVELAETERYARTADLAGALAELEGAIDELLSVEPTPEQEAASRAYRLDGGAARAVQAEVAKAAQDARALAPRPRDEQGRFASRWAHKRRRDGGGRFV